MHAVFEGKEIQESVRRIVLGNTIVPDSIRAEIDARWNESAVSSLQAIGYTKEEFSRIPVPPIRPLYDRILVRRAKTPDKEGSIVIPDQAKEKPLEGTVIAVGPGVYLEREGEQWFKPTQLKPGQRILFTGSVNVNYPDIIEDGELVMMSEQDVIGVLG